MVRKCRELASGWYQHFMLNSIVRKCRELASGWYQNVQLNSIVS